MNGYNDNYNRKYQGDFNSRNRYWVEYVKNKKLEIFINTCMTN